MEQGTKIAVAIRDAVHGDLGAITDIYNEAVLNTTATFDLEPRTLGQQERWLEEHGERHPVIVAEADGRVVGWASLTRYSERKAYDGTVEMSFYVHVEFRGRGIGRALNAAITERARALGYHTIIARIAGDSEASLRVCDTSGYVRVGTLREVGRKFDRLLDVHILQLML